MSTISPSQRPMFAPPRQDMPVTPPLKRPYPVGAENGEAHQSAKQFLSNAKLFHGTIPALLSPFTQVGDLDVEAVAPLVNNLLEGGAEGLYLCGSTGEGMSMSVAERKQMTAATLRAVGGRVPVMVMVGACPVEDAIALAKHADDMGAVAISSVAPGAYPWLGEPAATLPTAVQFFSSVARATELPFYPYWLGGALADAKQYLAAMRGIPTFAGLKYTSGDLYTLQQLRAWAPSVLGRELNLLSGCDEVNLAACTMGADGAIGSTYNLMPRLFVAMRTDFELGRAAEAMELQRRANVVIEILLRCCHCDSRGTNIVAGLKAACRQLQGLPAGYGRAATRSVTWSSEDEAELLAELRAVGFQVA